MILYHGSPILISDIAFSSHSYFTKDIQIAKSYGKFIYKIKVDKLHQDCFELDILKEHYISKCIIPIEKFEILNKTI